MPHLLPPTPSVGKINKIVPISEGGTGADNIDDAIQNLGAIKATMINQPGGPLGLDDQGHLTLDPSKINLSSSPAINGPLSVETGSVTNYQITNFHANTVYTVVAISGSVVVNGETIVYTAPGTRGTGGFTVNGRNYFIDVTAQMPNTPSITSPVNGSTGVAKTVSVTGNAFSISNATDTHEASHWQISTSPTFANIVAEAVDDTVNKTAWTSGNLDANITYFVRVRYKGTTYGYSEWSSSVSFSTKSRFTPNVEKAKLVASDPENGDLFGAAVALSNDGNTMAVAATYKSTATGAVYIFTRSNGNWTQQQKLQAADAAAQSWFGNSVALSSDGNTVAVGAHMSGSSGGAVYVFTRSGNVWTQQQKLVASDSGVVLLFGQSVSISSDGNSLAIGATGDSSSAGAAYVFTRSSNTWTEQQKLTPSDSSTNDHFGVSVAISGDGNTLMVGAELKQENAGAAYVFVKSGSLWNQQAKLTLDNVTDGQFGITVTLSSNGSTAVVGAYSEASSTGAAYVFTRSNNTWTQQQRLVASDATANDKFGGCLSLSDDGNMLTVSASAKSSSTGAAYLFVKSGPTWVQDSKVTASDAAASDNFGSSIALSRDSSTMAVGAMYEDPSSTSNAGSIYVFG